MKLLIPLMLLTAAGSVGWCNQPVVIAHRGASGYLPEHTLAAKAMAHAMGADFIEQDLVLSKDGVPMVLHDIFLDTVTDVARRHPSRKRGDGRYYVLDFTVAELKQLRVTERIDVQTGRPVFPGRFPAGQSSFQLSTFEEELQLIQGLNRSSGRAVGVYPEIKQPKWHRSQGHDISPIVLSVLAQYGYVNKLDACWLQCFDEVEVRRLRHELDWKGHLLLLIGDKQANDLSGTVDDPWPLAGLQELAKTVDGLGPPISRIVSWTTSGRRSVTNLVKHAHAAKLIVHAYTVRLDELPPHCPSSDELHAALFGDAGLDGVFTDFPDATVRWREKHAARKVKTPNAERMLER